MNFSSLGSALSGALGGAGIANFALQAGTFTNGELVVVRFEGTEKLNQPFVYEVTVESTVEPDDASKGIHGFPARLCIQSPGQDPRRVEGLVSGFAAIGADTREGQKFYHYRLRIVPRLWVLSIRRAHRMFQHQTAIEIVRAVLKDLQIVPTLRLLEPAIYRPIPFVYQRGETDLEFVNRVLALAGLTYFFVHSLGAPSDFPSRFGPSPMGGSSSSGPLAVAESMVIADWRYGMSDIGVPESPNANGTYTKSSSSDNGGPLTVPADADTGSDTDPADSKLPFDADGKSGAADESIATFEADYELAPCSIAVRDWITGQHLWLDGASKSDTSHDRIGDRPDTDLVTFEYQRDGSLLAADKTNDCVRSAERSLEQVRSSSSRATGKSDCRRLAPGYRFTLTGHPIPSLNAEFVVTAVRSQGTNPEKLLDASTPVYENQFECIPASIVPRPAKPDPLPSFGPEAATVIGDAEGLPQCDAQGRVRVRFHWAQKGDTKAGAEGECSVRWLERWAGMGYGTVTVPRTGSEVWVEFPRHEGGEPVATGQLYSSRNPPPFSPMTEPHRVGVRTQSLPISGKCSGGFNEISMLDMPSREILNMRAQRDMSVNVLHDQDERVGQDRSATVGRFDSVRVGVDSSETVGNNKSVAVGGSSATIVAGNRSESVGGDASSDVLGDLTENVTGRVTRRFQERHDATFVGDAEDRHVGHKTVVVGDSMSKRSYTVSVTGSANTHATGAINFESDLQFNFICGDSQITMNQDTIAITSPTITLNGKTVQMTATDTATMTVTNTFVLNAKDANVSGSSSATVVSPKTKLAGQSANIVLDSNVTAEGSAIKLGNGSSSASSSKQDTQPPPKVTTITFSDSQGNPLAYQRAILRKGGDGGEERVLALDVNGSATVGGDGPFDVSFSDLSAANSVPGATYEPHVVRQGEYVAQLAARFGFDADAVWNHSSNAKLVKLGRDPNVLAPGDVIYFPEAKRKWSPVSVGAGNRFTADPVMADVQVEFGAYGTVWANEAYTIEGVALPPGNLTGAGLLAVKIPMHVQTFVVQFPRIKRQRVVQVGHLDPSDTDSGIRQRLTQLGYLVPHFAMDDNANMEIAVMRLQVANDKTPTGFLDDDTMQLLIANHGS